MFLKVSKNRRGFTLLEVMIAFSILVLVFISLSSSLPVGLAINKAAKNSTIAFYLAQEKAEELFSTDYDVIGTGEIETKGRLSNDSDSYLYYFQRETEVIYVDGDLDESATDTGLKKVSINVYYRNSLSSGEEVYNLTTLISQR